MDKGMRQFHFERDLHGPLFERKLAGAKREALEKVFAEGIGSHTLRKGAMKKEYEFDNFMNALKKHPDLKEAGWEKRDFESVEPLLREHFVAANDSQPEAAPEEKAA